MFNLKGSIVCLSIAMLAVSFSSGASTRRCGSDLSMASAHFESAIQYDDRQTKANPTVHVWINGKAVQMLLDTGANVNSLWDESLLDEIPSQHFKKFDGAVVSVDARRVEATLGDAYGNSKRQRFYLLANSALAADGYAGVLSPQAIAGQDAVVIDFQNDCFFTGPPFEVGSSDRLHVNRGKTISAPYDDMAIFVKLDGRRTSVFVDSGAYNTTLLASLVTAKPKGRETSKAIDMFGAEIPRYEHTRLVDLDINGQRFESHPVVPASNISDKDIGAEGFIGMDILKGRVIYFDRRNQEFILMTRHNGTPHSQSAFETRAD